MNISSATAPSLFSVEPSDKVKAAYGENFQDVLEKRKAENGLNAADVKIAVSKTESVQKEQTEPSYTVTEEEAEYLREKYGEDYNYENRFKLFSELAEKNIISRKDADTASRKNPIVRITGLLPPPDVMDRAIAKYGYCHFKLKAPIPWENSEYGDSYEKYKEQNDMPINTWQDYVQDNYNYYQYIRENYTEICDSDGKPYIRNADDFFGKYCESVKKVQSVLDQIFG